MTFEEFKKQGYQLIQYAKITEERSIDLNDYDPTKKINEYETPFSLEYNVKDSYFDDSSFPLEYEILDKNNDIVEDDDNNIANFNSFRDAIDYIQNKM